MNRTQKSNCGDFTNSIIAKLEELLEILRPQKKPKYSALNDVLKCLVVGMENEDRAYENAAQEGEIWAQEEFHRLLEEIKEAATNRAAKYKYFAYDSEYGKEWRKPPKYYLRGQALIKLFEEEGFQVKTHMAGNNDRWVITIRWAE